MRLLRVGVGDVVFRVGDLGDGIRHVRREISIRRRGIRTSGDEEKISGNGRVDLNGVADFDNILTAVFVCGDGGNCDGFAKA